MKPFLSVACSLALVCLVASAARCEENQLPAAARTILQKAAQFELLSLDPAPEKDKSRLGFHGYRVLGKTAVKDVVQKKLVEAFLKGTEGDIAPAKCFDPRHGIRATHDGKTVELVICFECSQFKLYVGSEEADEALLVGKTPEPVFDKVLKDAGIPKAR